jgi:hypothetical protein
MPQCYSSNMFREFSVLKRRVSVLEKNVALQIEPE